MCDKKYKFWLGIFTNINHIPGSYAFHTYVIGPAYMKIWFIPYKNVTANLTLLATLFRN